MAKTIDEEYICREFRAGKTTTELKEEFGCTTQGIQRLLRKNGLTRKDGGKHAQMAARKVTTSDHPKAMCDKYGCTKEQWDRLRAMDEDYKKTPLAQFHTFKNNFQNINPGVEFNMTMWEWWCIWEKSGMWGKHKRNPDGMHVMVQIDKAKPLTSDNAQIVQFGDHLRATRKTKKDKELEIA